MAFIDWIIVHLYSLGDWFYNVYLQANSWAWPFNLVAGLFKSVSDTFDVLAMDFFQFGLWVDDVWNKVALILSWDSIRSFILSWIPNLETIRDWFVNYFANVTWIVSSWWSATQVTVQGWVQNAANLATTLFNSVNAAVTSLQAVWDSFKGMIPSLSQVVSWFSNWWGNVARNLVDWWCDRLRDLEALFNSWIANFAPFWAGWQDVRDNVIEFLNNPFEWLVYKLERWFWD